MENGKWKMENGKWKMENGKWKMENGKWKMENGKWKMENEADHIERHHNKCDSAPSVGSVRANEVGSLTHEVGSPRSRKCG
jgi:hypothetical protein